MNGNFFAPGHYPGMSNDAYHSAPGVSKSKLDAIDPESGFSPLHYWHKHVRPDREPEVRTEALILGDAIHKAILEPDLVDAHFIVVPEDAPRRPTKAQLNAKKPSLESKGAIDYWRDFTAEHAGKEILKRDQMDIVLGCRDSAWANPQVSNLLSAGEAEQSYFAIDAETGALTKCRLDWSRLEIDGGVVDLKSTEDASPRGFSYSARKYRYDVQDPWYRDVLAAAHQGVDVVEYFSFIAIEKEPPHAIGIYYLEPEEVKAGRELARRDLELIIRCEREGRWPDFSERPQPLRIRRAA